MIVLNRSLTAALCCVLGGSLTAQNYKLHSFEKRQLAKAFYCEGATFGDINGDRKPDLVAGPFWYEGPEFDQKHAYYKPRGFNRAVYSDNFFAFVYDFNSDGRNDIFIIGFPGKDASWYENPGPTDDLWPRHKVFDVVDNESPTLADIVGDSRPELVCQTGGRMGWAAPDWAAPDKPWAFHPVSKKGVGGRFTHGLGVGDIDGDGRKDIVWRSGWWGQPAQLDGDPLWSRHDFAFAGRGGAQMYVYDVDGDGDSDVITSENAHGYGLSWFEQVAGDGGIGFKKHRIMGSKPADNRYGIVIGNLHALDLVDMDGDGLEDIVTGNRFWAHGGRDPADLVPPPLFWFRLVRAAEGKGAHYVPHLIDENSGVGVQVVAGDVTGDDIPDVVVGNKMGTFVHVHHVEKVTRAKWMEARRKAIAKAAKVTLAYDRSGPVPAGTDGQPLNLDFETGTLEDWTATGTAFNGMPIKGDTVHARRSDSRSEHAGKYWIGSYEPKKSDRPTGTLASVAFEVTHPYASFLVGGGKPKTTRVEIIRADTDKVVFSASGRNSENMWPRFVDLTKLKGKKVYIRLVDEARGGWGHINFDDFRFHDARPEIERNAESGAAGKSPLEAAKAMSIPNGFHVDLVVGEPDLQQPIALTIDESGRLWVAEAYSYPVRRKKGKGRDKIVVFDDRDGDGAFETRHVFAENLNLVSGLEVGFGGVWVGAAPNFMFIPDRDGDLVPDGPPQVLLDGWGYQDTHETLNAFTWGPDGWLYGCHGVFTHSKVGKPGTPDAKRTKINAGVWRYHPTKHRFEVFAWGTSNPWGVDFDVHGQAFVTACVIPHLFHMVQGGRFHRQAGSHFGRYVFDDIKTVADHLHYLGSNSHAGNGISDSVGGGHAHCGAMIYLGDSFPATYRGRMFVNNIHGNRVNNDVFERAGSGFVATHAQDFLIANDRWFRGINLKYGPSGSVYLIDWYDKQACHLSQPEKWDRTNGRLYRVSYADTKPVRVDLGKLSDAELVALQLHDNEWFVRTARRLLQQRGHNPRVHGALAKILDGDPDPRNRLRALWALHVTGGLTRAIALRQLDSPHEYLRAWTIQLVLEDRVVFPGLAAKLEKMAIGDPSPVVRLYLAAALQRLPAGDRIGIARGLVGHGEDRSDHNLPLMIWYGFEPCVMQNPELALDVARASKIPEVARFIVRRLAADAEPRVGALVTMLDRAPEMRAMITREMLAAMKTQDHVRMPGGWRAVARRMDGDPAVRDAVANLSALFGDSEALQPLHDLLADRRARIARRERALATLLKVGDRTVVPVLARLIDDRPIARRAIRGLAKFDDAKSAALLIRRYGELGSGERREAVATLTSRAGFARAMLEAVVAKRMPASVLDAATTRRRISALKDAKVDALMVEAWGRAKPVAADKRKLIESWKKRLRGDVIGAADLPRGRAVFEKTCMRCHMLFGVGRKVGPDLTGSNRADLTYILQNILNPSGEVAKEYLTTSLMTKHDQMINGILVAETDKTVTLKNETDTEVVARADIKIDEEGKPAIWTESTSLMPEGQLDSLKFEEVRDLVGYLASDVQVPMAATPGNLGSFFNHRDLQGWDADSAVWSVENGEIVGRTMKGLAKNNFARNHLLLGDFRLRVKVKLVGNRGNSGIQFRSTSLDGGLMQGYQADIGVGWWGKLYEEHRRGLLWKKPGDALVKPGEWNDYEVEAIGDHIRTKLNGKLCVDLKDPEGRRNGIIGLQVHSGGPTEVRFKDFELELR